MRLMGVGTSLLFASAFLSASCAPMAPPDLYNSAAPTLTLTAFDDSNELLPTVATAQGGSALFVRTDAANAICFRANAITTSGVARLALSTGAPLSMGPVAHFPTGGRITREGTAFGCVSGVVPSGSPAVVTAELSDGFGHNLNVDIEIHADVPTIDALVASEFSIRRSRPATGLPAITARSGATTMTAEGLPPGLRLANAIDAAGVLTVTFTGLPNTNGTFDVTLRAKNRVGLSNPVRLTIDVW